MHPQGYIQGLLEELKGPRSKDHEARIRAELARLGIEAPAAKGTKAAAPVANTPQAPVTEAASA